MNTPVDIDKLKELVKRATPGPWVAIEASSMKYCSAVEYRSDVPGLSQTVCQVREDGPLVGASRLSEQNANACLIAEMRNALAALIAKAERVDALERALTEAASTFDQFTAALREHDPVAMAQEIAVAELAASEARNARIIKSLTHPTPGDSPCK